MNRVQQQPCHVNRRRTYIINPSFQWKYAAMISVTVFLASAMIGIVLFGVLHHQARMRAADPFGYTADVSWVIALFGLGFAALTAGGVGLWSILLTHRISGPMFVLKRYMLELASGRIPTLRPLRRKDEFKDLYAAFDTALDSLRAKKKCELEALTEAVEVARTALRNTDDSRTSALETIVNHLDTLRTRTLESLGGEADLPAPAATPKSTSAPLTASNVAKV